MGDVVKTIISNSLKAIEQGALQDFCLSFLPIYDSRFNGLERHGGTATGKTRAGTPDLLKTNPDGSHICVQCSVEQDYWSRPKKNTDDWKPIKDINECLSKIKNIKEIVLCSSQEIPTNYPNAKADIISYVNNIDNKIVVTLFSVSNFEEELSIAKKYSEIIKKYIPDLYEVISASAEKRELETVLLMYKKHPASLSSIEAIVAGYFKDSSINPDLAKIEMEVTRVSRSRFEHILPSETKQINRKSVADFYAKNATLGNLFTITGVPKIGKTNWTTQLCLEMKRKGLEIIWFDTPYESYEQKILMEDFKRIVIGKAVGYEIANQYVDKKISKQELNTYLEQSISMTKCLVVFDNAEHFAPEYLLEMKAIWAVMQRAPIKENFGIIYISRKKLKQIFGSASRDVVCPRWDESEIRQLLEFSKVDIVGDITKYCGLLTSFSGGHPLLAISMAKRAKSIQELLVSKLTPASALQDEDLTEDFKQILFNDLLKDDDHRDIVLRISLLTSRFKLNLMEFMSLEINPSLRTPAKLILENLEGNLIEGDESLGYQVAFIFKRIASNYIPEEQKRVIYDKISRYLMTPKNHVIDADEAADAVFYAMMAGKLRNAFMWTNMLLFHKGKKPYTQDQLKYLLTKLSVLEALNFPKEKEEKLSYYMTLLALAVRYSEINEIDKANEIFRKLIDNPVKQEDLPNGFHITAQFINAGTQNYYMISLLLKKEYDAALFILNKCDIEPFLKINSEIKTDLSFLHVAIENGKLSSFPSDLIKKMIISTSLDDELILGELAVCFCSMGLIAAKESNHELMRDTLSKMRSAAPLWSLFEKIAVAEFALNSKKASDCVKITDELIQLVASVGTHSDRLQARIYLTRGDAYYRMPNYDAAFDAYNRVSELLVNSAESFEFAWANYRMGLCANDDSRAIEYLNVSSRLFGNMGYDNLKGHSEAEKAALFYKLGRLEEAVKIVDELAEGYYVKKINKYAPVVTVGLAALTRLQYELRGEPCEAKLGYVLPKFERRMFSDISDQAKPEAGVCSAYFILGQVYKLLGAKELYEKALNNIIANEPITTEEKGARAASGLELLCVIAGKGAEDTIKEVIGKIFTEFIEIRLPSGKLVLQLMFEVLEASLKLGELSKDNYGKVLSILDHSVDTIRGIDPRWWRAEIYKRKAGIDGITADNDYDPALLVRAMVYALESDNYDVLRDVGHQLGFKHYHGATSIEHLARIHLAVLLGLTNDGGDITRLETLGTNIINLWSKIRYRSISEADLYYWHNLRDRIIKIVANVPEDLRAAIAILLVLSVNHEESNVKYDKARHWATERIRGQIDKMPMDEYEYIKKCFM